MAVIVSELFINNKFVPASSKETFELRSPFTNDLVANVAEATVEDVDAAVVAAQAAFPAWSALAPNVRGKPLRKMAEKIQASKRELAELEALSMGRPVDGYFDAEYASIHFNYFAEAGYAQGHTSLNTPGFLNMSLRQPFGVVAVVIPWNAPLVFFSKKVAPAVAAGCCVVLKSSEKAPLTSWKLASWIEECGFPPGVINVISGKFCVYHPFLVSLSMHRQYKCEDSLDCQTCPHDRIWMEEELSGKKCNAEANQNI